MDRRIKRSSKNLELYYAGFIILLACILGGGTSQGLWTDHLVEIALLPAMAIGFLNFFSNRLSTIARLFIALLVCFLALQFVPFAPPNALPEPMIGNPIRLWSVSPAGSLEATTYVISLVGFALFVANFSDEQQIQLIRFIFLGLTINILIAIVQLSFSGATRLHGILPYPITSATFSNENHLSAFVYMTIPLFAWRYLALEKRPKTYIVISCLLVAFLFAVGSRAGMAISAGIALFALFWFLIGSNKTWLKTGLLLAACLMLFVIFLNGGLEKALEGDLRLVFFKNTFHAFTDHWLTGTGLGTFLIVYPVYEQGSDVVSVYANHAHNDYLEVLMEGGMIAAALMLFYAVLIICNMFNNPLAEACALSIIVICLHSMVDYPLRTFGVAIVFTMLTAFSLLPKGRKINL